MKEFELTFCEVLAYEKAWRLTHSSRCVYFIRITEEHWGRVSRNPDDLFLESPGIKDNFLKSYTGWCHRWQRFHNFKCDFVYMDAAYQDGHIIIFFKDQTDLDTAQEEVQIAQVMLS